MTITVETGSGIPGANSYISLDDAVDYVIEFANNQGQYTEDSLTNDSLFSTSLIQAARSIDSLYGEKFAGFVANSSNPLLWPRTTFVDRFGRTVSSGTIPTALKQAQCELALQIYNGADVFPQVNKDANIESKSVSIDGAISTSVTYRQAPSASTYESMNTVESLLTSLLIKRTIRTLHL